MINPDSSSGFPGYSLLRIIGRFVQSTSRALPLGVTLIASSYGVLFAEWHAFIRRVAGDGSCPGELDPDPLSTQAPEIGARAIPPHLTCSSSDGGLREYWLGFSSIVFVSGIVVLLSVAGAVMFNIFFGERSKRSRP